MSDADNIWIRDVEKPPALIQSAPANKDQRQIAEIQTNVNTLLQTATAFPVRYQPPPEVLDSESGRINLSIVRANFEKFWDVKVINAKLSDDAARSLYWIISPKKTLEPVKIKKDDDDIDFSDLMSPLKF